MFTVSISTYLKISQLPVDDLLSSSLSSLICNVWSEVVLLSEDYTGCQDVHAGTCWLPVPHHQLLFVALQTLARQQLYSYSYIHKRFFASILVYHFKNFRVTLNSGSVHEVLGEKLNFFKRHAQVLISITASEILQKFSQRVVDSNYAKKYSW